MMIGYARVSTDGQTLDAQHASLKAAGAEKVFSEKESGAKTDRRQLQRAIAALADGDVILVTRLDRLAGQRGTCSISSLQSAARGRVPLSQEPMIDTTSAHGRLVTSILAVIGEFERELIRSRTDEGRTRAMARGVRFGRKPKLSLFQVREAIARREAGEALTEIGRSYGVSHSTISRL